MASDKIVTLDGGNFDERISKADTPVLVDFWAAWCGPCRAVAPVMETLAEDYGDKLTVGKLNVDENGAIAERFKVISIPTVMLFKGGRLLETMVGARQARDYKAIIDKHI